MSRSYKKVPCGGDRTNRYMKQYANKVVRQWFKQHPQELLFYNEYKKLFNSWNIKDYKIIETFEQFELSYKEYHPKEEITLDELKRLFFKYYIQK